MKMLFAASLAAFALAFSMPASADSCDGASTQADLNDCAGQDFQKADAELNDLYKQVMARLGNGTPIAMKLVAAQKAWLAFRDSECDFSSAGVEGGSIYPMIVVGCRERLTTERNADLKRYLHCEEGDMSCPVPAE